MWPNPQETVDLGTFTEEILNGKLFFFAVYETYFVIDIPEMLHKQLFKLPLRTNLI